MNKRNRNIRMKRILITGAGGFLGSRLVDCFVKEEDYEIYAVTRKHNVASMKLANDRLHVLSPEEYMEKAYLLGNMDIWINSAFPTGTSGENRAAGLDYICGLMKIVPSYVKIAIDISSQSIYDSQRKSPADENSAICLNDAYAVGKYMIEKMMDIYCKDIICVHLRLASLIGVGMEQRFINRFIRNICSGEAVRISGGGQIYGFLDAKDAVEGIVLMTKCLVNPRENICAQLSGEKKILLNLGNKIFYSLGEICDKIVQIGIRRGYIPQIIVTHEDEKWYNSSLDSTKFCSIFPWQAKYLLEDTIGEIYEDVECRGKTI